MQYIEMFFGCKNENFHWKNLDIFLIFAQNIDCGYMLEPPRCMHAWRCFPDGAYTVFLVRNPNESENAEQIAKEIK